MFRFLFILFEILSSQIQQGNDVVAGDVNDNDKSFDDSNRASFEMSANNINQQENSSDESKKDTTKSNDEDDLDEMFEKIIETLPLNKKVGQLIKKKTKTRTLAKCKICSRKISWFQRIQHKKEHSKSMLIPSSNDVSSNHKRSREESQQNSSFFQNKELNSNQSDDSISKPPDPKRHKGKIFGLISCYFYY